MNEAELGVGSWELEAESWELGIGGGLLDQRVKFRT